MTLIGIDRPLVGASIRLTLKRCYRSIMKDLRLTAVQASFLLDTLHDYQRQAMDYARAGRPDQHATNAILAELKAQLDRELRSLLGDDRFLKFDSYRARLQGRVGVSLGSV